MAQTVKNLPAMQETGDWSLGQENPLEKGMTTLSSVLTWRTPWSSPKELGGLSSMESQKVGHNWVTNNRCGLILSLNDAIRIHLLIQIGSPYLVPEAPRTVPFQFQIQQTRTRVFSPSPSQRPLPWWFSGKESACQFRRCGFNSWVRKIPRKRKWQPSSILTWRISWTEQPGGLQSMG